MNRPLCWLLCCLGLAACSEPTPPEAAAPIATPAPATPAAPAIPESELYLLTVGGNGFRSEMGLTGLGDRFGAEHVQLAPVPLGEGETEPGAIVYPDDPSRRAYVYFVDGKPDGAISAIYVRDETSRWRGPFDLKIGLTLLDLERLNGRAFSFLGFDWDYGGYVSNWADGTLAHALIAPGRLSVRLVPPPLAADQERSSGYPQGDGEFPSDLPAVREQPPLVSEFGVSFGP